MKKLYLTIGVAIVFLILALFSCGGDKHTDAISTDANRIPVKVTTLSQATDVNVIRASGQLTTDNETVLSFKTGGIVDAVFVREGDPVKRGQLLATLDLTEINAMVGQAREVYEKAHRDFERVSNLYKDSVATLEQLQNAQTGLSVAREQLEGAKFNRTFSEIHAPTNGYVLHKFVSAGQVAGPGTPVLITNDATQGKWIVKVSVSDKQWASIKQGNEASVNVDAYPGKLFTGRVVRRSERSDPQTGVFTVELQLKGNDKDLASGMFASVEIKSDEVTSFWEVPYESVLDANGSQGFVFITNDNNTAIRRSITIDAFTANTIRISKGLENASALIISGSAYLSDGSQLEIIK